MVIDKIKKILKNVKVIRWGYDIYIYYKGQKYSAIENEFIKKNRKLWLKNSAKNNDIILVDFTTLAPDNFWAVMKKANALREKNGYQIHVCLDGKKKTDFNNYVVINSFNPDKILFFEKEFIGIKELYCVIKTFCNLFINARKISTDLFVNYRYKNIKIGDCIYDTILRRDTSIYTVKKISIRFWKTFWDASKEFVVSSKLIKNNNVIIYLSPEYAYLREIRQRIALANGVKTWIVNERVDVKLTNRNIYLPTLSVSNVYSSAQLKSMFTDNDIKKQYEQYYTDRFLGVLDSFDAKNAFKNKVNVSIDEIKEYFKLNNNNKNILIASHVFSDVAHINKQYIFRDYYEWLMYCLEKTSNELNLNKFIKLHPSRNGYGENDITELVKKKYPQIHVIPDTWNTAAVIQNMDVVLTAAGTIAMEAACMGVPSMLVAESYYSCTGIVPVAKTLKEYDEFLCNLSNSHRITDINKINYAKFVLYLAQQRHRKSKIDLSQYSILPGDNWEESVNKQYEYLVNMMNDENNVRDNEYREWMNLGGI